MKNKGITLIALVITIVVLLILVGVSIGFSTGNNSVIDKADDARYKDSISQIEDLLNNIYTQNYNQIEEKNLEIMAKDTPITKARALAYYLEDELNENNIFSTSLPGGNYYTYHKFEDDKYAYVSSDGKIFYFLSPKNLKKYNTNITVLDLNEPSDRNGVDDLDYLYCVTSDLKVFVIKEDLNNLIGITEDDLIYYDFNSVIFEAGSDWTKVFGTENDITYQEGQSKKSITLNFKSISVSENFNFSGSGELKHLTSLSIKNMTAKDISGLAEAGSTLKYLWIENSTITSYAGIEWLKNLESLYLYNMTQDEVDKILSQMKGVDYPKLVNLGIIGEGGYSDYSQGFVDERYYTVKRNKITSIDKLADLTATTKNAVKNLFLTANSITSLKPLKDFNNLVGIRADANSITSLEGLNGKTKLEIIRINKNDLNDLNGLLESDGTSKMNALAWLDVRGNSKMLTDISAISTIKLDTHKASVFASSFVYPRLYFTSKSSFGRNDSTKIVESEILEADNKKVLLALQTRLQIDPEYAKLLVDDDTTLVLELKGEIDKSLFESYANCKVLDKLSINGLIIKDNNGNVLSASETNKVIGEVLSSPNLSTVRYLQVNCMKDKLTNSSFLNNFPNLVELDFRDNYATDLSGINKCTELRKLSIDNTSIDLTKIQTAINTIGYLYFRTDPTGYTRPPVNYWTEGQGLLLCSDALYNKLTQCTDIQYLYMMGNWRSQIRAYGLGMNVDLNNCQKLTHIYIYNIFVNFKMPSSLRLARYGYVFESNGWPKVAANGQSTNKKITTNDLANIKLDLSRCSKLEYLDFYNTSNANVIQRTVESLSDGAKNTLWYLRFYDQTGSYAPKSYSYLGTKFANYKALKELSITSYSTNRYRITEDLIGPNQIPSLEKISISYCNKLKDLPDMSALVNLKEININYCALENISAESNLAKLPKLEKINFSNNSISNLYGLVPQKDEDFSKLHTLNLSNNTLENSFSMGVVAYNLNTSVFIPLHNRKLRTLLISGNSITSASELENLNWTKLSY